MMDPNGLRCYTQGLHSGECDRMMTMNDKNILLQCLSQETEKKDTCAPRAMNNGTGTLAYNLVTHLLRRCGQLHNTVNK
jgi:hypothetical protein